MNNSVFKVMAAAIGLTAACGLFSCGDKDEEPDVVRVTSITLDKASADLEPGGTLTLTPVISPSGASNKNVSWSSSNDAVAAVSAGGVVTAASTGSATITAKTEDGGFTATCTVTVREGVPPSRAVVLEGEITGNLTLRAVDSHTLKGFVYVVDGATLTIEAGAVIKGDKASMGSLIVERGGKIIAEGTSARPIVFTSDQPKGSRSYGDWGGLILCGKAPTNNTTEPQIEGGPRSRYGGNDPADNSGILKYVRIEFAGYPFQPDKEINGLTCGGVGSGTTIEYVQVSFCGDDSFEWFGGTVNARHLVAYKGWDDEFDTDYGFSGKLQFLLGVRDPKHADTSKSNGFESDNDAQGSGNTPLTTPVFSNVTLIGPLYGLSAGRSQDDILYNTEDASNGAKGGQFQSAMHIRRNSSLNVYNSVFTGWPYGLNLDKANNGAVVRNVIFAGMWNDFQNDDSKTYFQSASLGNKSLTSTNDLIATNGDYSSVVASQIGGADFTDAPLTNSFFEKVGYKGAFSGANDWTAGWANFDPNNTDY
ncbi:MAG: Ig-like domain-containing protein [Tannerellaceae bacterium]|nr:Ig-like domain-containing protein [Tannerellaceae bacterium]